MRSPYDGRQSKDFHVLEFIDQSLGNKFQNREFSRKFSLKVFLLTISINL